MEVPVLQPLGQQVQIPDPVPIIPKDVLPPVSTGEDMKQRALEFKTRFSRAPNPICSLNCRFSGLTPLG